MPPRGLVRAFVLQWWTAGILLFVWSVQTARRAVEAGGGHNPHVMLLGVIEAVSAILFLIPRTMKIGAAGLLTTFAIAFAVHAAQGQFRGDLILYAAVVVFVAVHGAVPMSWLWPGLERPVARG
jgi:uncharacterized membrane protein YphA (DoxX/SURF4 family)